MMLAFSRCSAHGSYIVGSPPVLTSVSISKYLYKSIGGHPRVLPWGIVSLSLCMIEG